MDQILLNKTDYRNQSKVKNSAWTREKFKKPITFENNYRRTPSHPWLIIININTRCPAARRVKVKFSLNRAPISPYNLPRFRTKQCTFYVAVGGCDGRKRAPIPPPLTWWHHINQEGERRRAKTIAKKGQGTHRKKRTGQNEREHDDCVHNRKREGEPLGVLKSTRRLKQEAKTRRLTGYSRVHSFLSRSPEEYHSVGTVVVLFGGVCTLRQYRYSFA